MAFARKVLPTIEPSTDDFIYLAGFIDGEGCIRLVAHNKYRARANRHPSYHLSFGLANKHLPTLQWMQKRFGGSIHLKSRLNKNAAIAWEYRLSARPYLTSLLTGIAPYSKVKRDQVELALAFLELPPVKKVVISSRGKTWPLISGRASDYLARTDIVERFTALNRRGA